LFHIEKILNNKIDFFKLSGVKINQIQLSNLPKITENFDEIRIKIFDG